MRLRLPVLVWLFGRALRLYPRSYQAEYGSEMEWVFGQATEQASRRGAIALLRLALRELWMLPLAIVHEHWRARRKRTMIDDERALRSGGGSWREVLAALAPFLLLGIVPSLLGMSPLSGRLGIVLGIVVLSILGASVLALGVLGLIKGMPRWVLPYGGILLATVTASGLGFLVWKLQAPIWPAKAGDQWFARHVAYQGVIWAGLLILPSVLVVVSGLLSPLRPIYRRVRQDWTLVSFGLYGSALPALIIAFDDYRDVEPYMLAAVVLLVVGGWLYLRSERSWQRVLSLIGGLVLAMGVGAAGRAVLFSRADYAFPRLHFTPQTEALSTMIMGAWIAIALLIPAVFGFLPRVGGPEDWKPGRVDG